MRKIVFSGGTILDPRTGGEEKADILVVNGKIERISRIDPNTIDAEVIDVSDQWIVPGLVDMHAHLREPGREDEETLETGAQAAMAGGFTSLCCMPNTSPPIDSREGIRFIKEKTQHFLVEIHPIAAISKGLKGEELTEMAELVSLGAVAFSDDGNPVMNSEIMRRALEYVKMFGVPIIDHCEDLNLSQQGVMNEGYWSTCLGFKGIPAISEEIMVARDLLLTEFTGGRIHIAHVSTKGSVQLIQRAKERGVNVTCEVCPHHFSLTDEAVKTFNTNLKVKPPLRTEEDVEALKEGLKKGIIDVIATDHAPHSIEEKEVEFDAAPFGMLGLETALGLAITQLVEGKVLSLSELITKMAINPRRILGLEENLIKEGYQANFTVFDPQKEWVVKVRDFKSKSHNSPFDGWKLKGKVFGVFNKGQWWRA